MAFTLRPFSPNDAAKLLALMRDTVRRVNSREYSPEQIAALAFGAIESGPWAERFNGRFAVGAEPDGRPIGFADLETSGHSDRFYVAADRQRSDVGSAMLAAILAEARRLGLRRLSVAASLTAGSFFERQGFLVVTPQTVVCREVEFVNLQMERDLKLAGVRSARLACAR